MPNNPWLSLIWVILCVAAIVGLAYWFTKHVAARGFPGGMGNRGAGRLKVLAQVSLGRDEALVLIQAGGRYFLLGATPAGITNLAEFTGEEAERWAAEEAEQPVPPSFRESLRTVIQQKKQR